MEICQKFENVSVCRLCGQKKRFEDVLNIEKSDDLLLKIRKLLPVVVLIGDPLPQDVCYTCKEKLEDFHKFYDMTQQTESSLKSLLNLSPLDGAPVIKPLIQFHNLLGPSLTHFLQPKSKPAPSPKERLVEKRLNKTRLFSCLDCKRTWVSEPAAINHTCSARKESKTEQDMEKELKNRIKNDKEGVPDVEKQQKGPVKACLFPNSDLTEVLFVKGTKKAVDSFHSDLNEQNNNYSVKSNSGSFSSSHTKKVEAAKSTSAASDMPTENKQFKKIPAGKEQQLRHEALSNEKKPAKRSRSKSICDETQQWKKWKGQWDKEKKTEASENYICEPQPFECDLCGKLFEYRAELTLHAGIHRNQLGSGSDVCNIATALDFIARNRQPATGEGSDRNRFISTEDIHLCSFCDLSFKRKATLVSHLQSHIEKSFDICWSDDGT